MYKQEQKAGTIQYLLSIIVCIIIWVVCDIIGLVINNSFIADIIFAVLMIVVIYFIYVHYCAVFNYELTEKKLIATRKIGKREIKEEITLSKIKKIYFTKPKNLPKHILYMTVNILKRKNFCYIIYDKESKCLVIEPDKKLTQILKENING